MNTHPNTLLQGVAAPLPYSNLDTDQIMPKQFLRIIDKAGLDRGLLYDLRFDPAGAPRPGFVLNREPYRRPAFLVAGPNFGCGSSREHAVWGLQQFGVRAIIAPSFGEIFYANAMNNGLLLIRLPDAQVQALLDQVSQPQSCALEIDVLAGQVRAADGVRYDFSLSPRHRGMVAEGLDMVAATLRQLPEIARFEAAHRQRHPWLQDAAAGVRARLDQRSEGVA
ncbi:3-isopropylmalate dehydratase small subunit [Bordetella genomosp. 1]|uniref:3-isopropylmalate dehydratase small subunit n=1 Tax=Bordetella genomosp. 1 TaxID=1395607 RepID=A0ABX4F362_9BORD|nr:3-isopropylmalate dehydratase small subunit [Bordetella genomosp. 1]OZI68193.1 3-isopropylmalate dehydratase small subunit [Bordetella genomosp. 1]